MRKNIFLFLHSQYHVNFVEKSQHLVGAVFNVVNFKLDLIKEKY